jgi:tetratricopeptide (TPR) repeat protein
MGMIENMLGMLERGQDTALLRYSLGQEYARAEQWEAAEQHLARAVELDPGYSAAWKLYGKVLASGGRPGAAIPVLEQGIEVAEARGDVQAAKEMHVFLKRARKAAG